MDNAEIVRFKSMINLKHPKATRSPIQSNFTQYKHLGCFYPIGDYIHTGKNVFKAPKHGKMGVWLSLRNTVFNIYIQGERINYQKRFSISIF